MPMDTNTGLHAVIRQRYDAFADALDEVRRRFRPGGADLDEPRHTRGMVDRLLADISQHVNAANAVLVPAAKRHVAHDHEVVHAYLDAAKHLEVVLAHVKAHAYGSTFELKFTWAEAWDELEEALGAQRAAEEELARQLADAVAEEDAVELAERLRGDEAREPTRPHPYAPHTGVRGSLARRVMRRVDSFWDTAEGRMVRRERKPRKRPGLIGRYIMASPEIDED